MEWEISITLSKEELKSLEKNSLVGIIKRYSQREYSDEILLKIKRGKTSKWNESLDLATSPPDVYWEKAAEYHLKISESAYKQLQEEKMTGERIYLNPACKISIHIR